MKAHQRLIREQEAERDPRSVIPLSECRVEAVGATFAKGIIYRYEWLGTMPMAPVAQYGLIGPNGEPLGVVVFGLGSGSKARDVCGEAWRDRTIVLERGACVHYAHEHAGSFLISRAVKMMSRDRGFSVFLAYSDSAAGEIGTIYQACGWHYLGSSNGRKGNFRYEGRPVGADRWMSSRNIRVLIKRTGISSEQWWREARTSGQWEFRRVYDRARYVTFVGSRKERAEAGLALRYPVLPYPKRETSVGGGDPQN